MTLKTLLLGATLAFTAACSKGPTYWYVVYSVPNGTGSTYLWGPQTYFSIEQVRQFLASGLKTPNVVLESWVKLDDKQIAEYKQAEEVRKQAAAIPVAPAPAPQPKARHAPKTPVPAQPPAAK